MPLTATESFSSDSSVQSSSSSFVHILLCPTHHTSFMSERDGDRLRDDIMISQEPDRALCDMCQLDEILENLAVWPQEPAATGQNEDGPNGPYPSNLSTPLVPTRPSTPDQLDSVDSGLYPTLSALRETRRLTTVSSWLSQRSEFEVEQMLLPPDNKESSSPHPTDFWDASTHVELAQEDGVALTLAPQMVAEPTPLSSGETTPTMPLGWTNPATNWPKVRGRLAFPSGLPRGSSWLQNGLPEDASSLPETVVEKARHRLQEETKQPLHRDSSLFSVCDGHR